MLSSSFNYHLEAFEAFRSVKPDDQMSNAISTIYHVHNIILPDSVFTYMKWEYKLLGTVLRQLSKILYV